MNNITFVTTFHEKGLELYAQRFLDSFSENVDKRVNLLVYAEKCNPRNPDPEQITIYDADNELKKLQKFKENWKDVPKANGVCPFPEKRPRDHHKGFKWDALRFSNKVYAVFDAAKKSSDWCVWIDADTYIHSPWSYEEMLDLFPENIWVTYVGRGKNASTWPECGFYGFNLNQKPAQKFLKRFESMYENAEEGIFTLEEWHDSYVFGYLLGQFLKKHPNVLDYSKELVANQARTGGGGHPMINTRLGYWLDHLKGNRKYHGKSKNSELIVNIDNDYWSSD